MKEAKEKREKTTFLEMLKVKLQKKQELQKHNSFPHKSLSLLLNKSIALIIKSRLNQKKEFPNANQNFK